MLGAGEVRTIDNKKEIFLVSLLFHLLKYLIAIFTDTQLCSKERTGIMLDDKTVVSKSSVTLG